MKKIMLSLVALLVYGVAFAVEIESINDDSRLPTANFHSNSADLWQLAGNEPSWEQAPSKPTCDWNPRRITKADAFNCGRNDVGMPNLAIYECGLASNCEKYCVFVECVEF